MCMWYVPRLERRTLAKTLLVLFIYRENEKTTLMGLRKKLTVTSLYTLPWYYYGSIMTHSLHHQSKLVSNDLRSLGSLRIVVITDPRSRVCGCNEANIDDQWRGQT